MSIAVVIGASAAGIAAAHSLSRRFRKVLLIERRAGLNLRQRFRTTSNVHVWEDAEAVYLLPSAAGVGGGHPAASRRPDAMPAGGPGGGRNGEQRRDGAMAGRHRLATNQRSAPTVAAGNNANAIRLCAGMKLAKFGLLMLVIAAVAYGQAQRHELALTLGGVNGAAAGIGLTAGSGTALQANYGVRLVNRARAALYGEVHFLSSPLREVTSANRLASRDFASLYVTPGVRVRFRPAARVSPWVSGGAGWALYENSTLRQDGQPNNAARLTHRGAVQFGGGVDVPVWRFVALRAEIRDFYTGRPGYNVSVPGGGQHNVVAGGGLVFRFGAAAGE